LDDPHCSDIGNQYREAQVGASWRWALQAPMKRG